MVWAVFLGRPLGLKVDRQKGVGSLIGGLGSLSWSPSWSQGDLEALVFGRLLHPLVRSERATT